jgi:hypothetical protein
MDVKGQKVWTSLADRARCCSPARASIGEAFAAHGAEPIAAGGTSPQLSPWQREWG